MGQGLNRLVVNLTDGTTRVERIASDIVSRFLGGRALNASSVFQIIYSGAFNYDFQTRSNVIFIAPGLLTGTTCPSSSRCSLAVTMSPVTGRWADSNLGGFFGAELRHAGFLQDAIMGKSKSPVVLVIEDGRARIEPAGMAWGRGVYESTEYYKSVYDRESQVLVIGPAGEKLVAYAIPMCGDRAPGGGGIGAVFGSKKLKAVIVRGTRGVEPARPQEFLRECLSAHQHIRSNPLYRSFSEWGTSMITPVYEQSKSLPINNWTSGSSTLAKNFSPGALASKSVRSRACFGCPIHCSHHLDSGFEGAEYEALNGLGLKIGVGSLEDALDLTKYFNDMGLDVVQASGVISMLMEATKNREAEVRDRISFGDVDGVRWMVHQWIYEDNKDPHSFARGLGQGSARYLDGRLSKYSAAIKGVMPPSLDFRAPENFAATLACMTATRGADHLRSLAPIEAYGSWYGRDDLEAMAAPFGIPDEIMREWLDQDAFSQPDSGVVEWRTFAGKASIVAYFEDQNAVTDAVGICRFASSWRLGVGLERLSRLVTTYLGKFGDWHSLRDVGRRTTVLERWMNSRVFGLKSFHDMPPVKMREQALNGFVCDGKRFELVRNEFYKVKGLDQEGSPTKKNFRDLGMEDFL